MCLVVRHTMQALPLRSMSNPQSRSDKTQKFRNSRFLRAGSPAVLLLAILAILASAPHGVVAQQATAIHSSSSTPVVTERAQEILIDASIPDDSAIEKMLKPYAPRVRALNVVIGKLEGELRKGPVGAGNLGNFVADGIRSQASVRLGKPVVLAITNSGGLRKNTIAEGELRAVDIFELLPFENALVAVDLTGEPLLQLLAVVLGSGDAQSGAIVKYRITPDNKFELVSAKMLDAQGRETDIDPSATYTIVTIDYLLNVASGRYSILQQAKNVKPLGVTIRDAMMDYVKAETAAGRPVRAQWDGRFASVTPGATKPEAKPEGQPE